MGDLLMTDHQEVLAALNEFKQEVLPKLAVMAAHQEHFAEAWREHLQWGQEQSATLTSKLNEHEALINKGKGVIYLGHIVWGLILAGFYWLTGGSKH